jgi:hypothetical protein
MGCDGRPRGNQGRRRKLNASRARTLSATETFLPGRETCAENGDRFTIEVKQRPSLEAVDRLLAHGAAAEAVIEGV